MSGKLIPVQSADAEIIWEHVAPLLQKAIDKTSDSFSTDDIRELVRAAKAQLWVAVDGKITAAFITTIEASPSDKWVRVMWCGGEDSEWLPQFEAVERWAKSIGASKVMIFGRKGWTKKLPTYRQSAVVLEKKL